MAEKQVKVKLVRSTNGRLQSHKDCVRGLGLRKIGSERVVAATPENMGMVKKVHYLLEVEEV